MKSFQIRRAQSLKGAVSLLGDKSVAHRALFISALTKGITRLANFPVNRDSLATVAVLRKLGIRIVVAKKKNSYSAKVFGRGLKGLRKPKGPLFVRESGTTLRLLLGVLAGQDFAATVNAGRALSRRPMRRVFVPLRMMGATIRPGQEEYPPLVMKGGHLRGIRYTMPVASAQVKSAILLAGLNAEGLTRVVELTPTRDHTERMLRLFKARIAASPNLITIQGNTKLVTPRTIHIPGDFSSASFFIVAACMVPGSKIMIKNVGLNPTRSGILKVLRRMGAKVGLQALPSKLKTHEEPMGNLVVMSSSLRGTTVKRGEIPSLIDELPILMIAASTASGRTVFEGVEELRVKETDRIKSMSENLKKMGANIRIASSRKSEKIIISGTKGLEGAKVRSFGDHRTAMSMVVAGMVARGVTTIDDVSCIKKSFPGFLALVKSLMR